jgi:uncharacterized protein DUF5132
MARRLVTPYLFGLVTAPLVGTVAKPLLRSALKATVALVLQAKKLAAEAGEEFQDLVAEVSTDVATMPADVTAKTAQSRRASVARRDTA